ncbi:PDR/VanB family oxidoreductase [Jiella mangrovi]|uniref:Oxidoreductase n=1 Tax=Jiella mangrovi TaxID=2821407 RepID=A0ABS4BL47_9HYPH|nr:PDR/VanB family oxidoreductase [Jiella mangrovi]MBP0617463.1 oxidoreductase [Jiella mangrovi]
MKYDRDWVDARVIATSDVAEDVRHFEIVPDAGPAPSWSPGSHINLQVMIGERTDTRSYSLVGEPDRTAYRIAVRRQAESRGGSAYMWSLKPGARVRITNANNLFELDQSSEEYLLVAGGIGITPILGMALTLKKRGAPMRLVYTGRSRAAMPFVDLLSERLSSDLELAVSSEGQRLDIAAEIERLGPDAALYICGPMRLLDAARKAWAAAGRQPHRLRYETFGSSGSHAAEAFWVKIPELGVEVCVPENRTLLQSLEEAGVGVISDCQRGECGLCALDIVSLDGVVDHRDVFFSDQQRQENAQLCACVSRISGGGAVLSVGYRPD